MALSTDPWHNTPDRHGEHATLLAAVPTGDAATTSSLAKTFFDKWSVGYSSRMAHWGYDMPSRIAGLLRTHGYEHLAGGILDAGAGDGLSGVGLRASGITDTPMVALDVSPGMLELAKECGAYSRVVEGDLAHALPFEAVSFDATTCIGVLTYLAPSCGVLDEFKRVTRPGGLVCFNLRTDQLEAWQPELERMTSDGAWEMLEKQGPFSYLPGDPRYAQSVLAVAYAFRVLG